MKSVEVEEKKPLPTDAQLAELIETVWAAEAAWRLDDRIDAAVRYGR
jgi:hypothetical protein